MSVAVFVTLGNRYPAWVRAIMTPMASTPTTTRGNHRFPAPWSSALSPRKARDGSKSKETLSAAPASSPPAVGVGETVRRDLVRSSTEPYFIRAYRGAMVVPLSLPLSQLGRDVWLWECHRWGQIRGNLTSVTP
ncbi:unnamed protein product [Ectocarpus sp. 13 AM-2016]